MKIYKESYWINLASVKTCTVGSITESNENELRTKWYLKGDKPFPVKGYFNISYADLVQWLKANGWQRRNPVLPTSTPDKEWYFE